jgi:hypothetical protein
MIVREESHFLLVSTQGKKGQCLTDKHQTEMTQKGIWHCTVHDDVGYSDDDPYEIISVARQPKLYTISTLAMLVGRYAEIVMIIYP